MAEDSIKIQELLESLQNIAKDVLKIEEKIHKLNSTSNEKKIETVQNPIEFNAHISKKREIQTEKIEEIKQIKKPKLIISERTGYVHLPYTQSDIDYYKRCGYETEEEIARRFFTVPLKRYSNFSKSRVKERICFNEIPRKSRNNRITKICKEFKKRKRTTSSNNNSLQNTR